MKYKKEIIDHEIQNFPMVLMTWRSPVIHIEVDSKLQPFLYIKTSIPLELFFTTPAR